MPLKSYVDIILKAAKKHGTHVLNLFDVLPYGPPRDPEQIKRLTKEGLHFNDTGHHLLAEAMCQFLREMENGAAYSWTARNP